MRSSATEVVSVENIVSAVLCSKKLIYYQAALQDLNSWSWKITHGILPLETCSTSRSYQYLLW